MRRNARRGVRERYRDMEIEKWWERERERKANRRGRRESESTGGSQAWVFVKGRRGRQRDIPQRHRIITADSEARSEDTNIFHALIEGRI
jgi:hypothetical protein